MRGNSDSRSAAQPSRNQEEDRLVQGPEHVHKGTAGTVGDYNDQSTSSAVSVAPQAAISGHDCGQPAAVRTANYPDAAPSIGSDTIDTTVDAHKGSASEATSSRYSQLHAWLSEQKHVQRLQLSLQPQLQLSDLTAETRGSSAQSTAAGSTENRSNSSSSAPPPKLQLHLPATLQAGDRVFGEDETWNMREMRPSQDRYEVENERIRQQAKVEAGAAESAAGLSALLRGGPRAAASSMKQHVTEHRQSDPFLKGRNNTFVRNDEVRRGTIPELTTQETY